MRLSNEHGREWFFFYGSTWKNVGIKAVEIKTFYRTFCLFKIRTVGYRWPLTMGAQWECTSQWELLSNQVCNSTVPTLIAYLKHFLTYDPSAFTPQLFQAAVHLSVRSRVCACEWVAHTGFPGDRYLSEGAFKRTLSTNSLKGLLFRLESALRLLEHCVCPSTLFCQKGKKESFLYSFQY